MNEKTQESRLQEALLKNPNLLGALPPLYQRAAALLFPKINQNQNQKNK